jgi:hypothetical protein
VDRETASIKASTCPVAVRISDGASTAVSRRLFIGRLTPASAQAAVGTMWNPIVDSKTLYRDRIGVLAVAVIEIEGLSYDLRADRRRAKNRIAIRQNETVGLRDESLAAVWRDSSCLHFRSPQLERTLDRPGGFFQASGWR